MAVVDRLIGFASPTAALHRSIQLKDKGQLTEAFRLLAVAAKAGIAEAEHRVASGNRDAGRRSPDIASLIRATVTARNPSGFDRVLGACSSSSRTALA
jgi:hypothetical protein